MDYDNASDFEINKAVAEDLGHKALFDNNGKLVINSEGMGAMEVDYCNNISDAWLIIVENMIDIIIDKPVCTAYEDAYGSHYNSTMNNMDTGISEHHSNPLRAAMIVFLKLKEQQDG